MKQMAENILSFQFRHFNIIYILLLGVTISGCDFRPSASKKDTTWLNQAIFYEIPIRNTAKEPLPFLANNHIYHLSNMHVNTLVLPPPQAIDNIEQNSFQYTFYPICDFHSVDPKIGHPDSLYQFIAHIHKRNFRLVIEWPIYYTGDCHKWTKEHPEYYVNGGTEKVSAHSLLLDMSNPKVWEAMVDEIAFWLEDYDLDGFVFQGWDKLPKEGQDYIYQHIKAINGVAIISDSERRIVSNVRADARMNYSLYNWVDSIFQGKMTVEQLKSRMVAEREQADEVIPINFSSTLALNRHHGSYAVYFRRAYLGLTAFIHTSRGLSWMMGGQEIAISYGLTPDNHRPINWSVKAHTAYFQSLFNFKLKNKALWPQNNASLSFMNPQNEQILVYKNKAISYEQAGIFNMSSSPQELRMTDHLMNLNEYQTNKRIFIEKDRAVSLTPWQYILLGNN